MNLSVCRFLICAFAFSIPFGGASLAFAKEKTAEQIKQIPEFVPPPLLPGLEEGYSNSKAAEKYHAFCGIIRINSEIDFTDMERRLLCGDSSGDEIGRPWQSVPANEATYFLHGFLQARGYHQPRFIQDGVVLFVSVGPLSRLESFRITGGPKSWEPPKKRLIEDELLTPALLNQLQAWSLSQIRNEGYACATVESRADPRTGQVVVYLTPGDFKYISRIENTGDSGLREDVLDRYNAFVIGDPYRERLIALTQRRTIEDGILQALVLKERCEPGPNLTIMRDVVLGAARTLRIGIGASTDEGPKVRTIVKQARIGDMASSAEVRITASYLRELVNHQATSAKFRWYYDVHDERAFIEPGLTYDHEQLPERETQEFEAKVLPGVNRDTREGSWELKAGPTFLDSYVARGEGPTRTEILFAEIDARWHEHDHEWFATSPRTGELIDASVLITQKKWGAGFTAQKLQVAGQKLWSIGRYDPPLLVLGLRFNASTVFSPDDDITSALPTRFLTFLGGESDLRGFEQQSLPRSGVGALSGVSSSLEARVNKVIYKRVDVFTFLDAGMLGGARMHLEKPVFMSPGVGLRWESPIGVLRGYLAQRFAVYQREEEAPYPRDYRLGFTFGEEF
jgi:translocation and assembly module TamA